jgi:hypothetical protein
MAFATATTTVTAASTRRRNGRRGAATAIAVTTATAVAAPALIRVCRGSDRQRSDARGEKHPAQHRKISFRTGKTVRSLHRSIA